MVGSSRHQRFENGDGVAEEYEDIVKSGGTHFTAQQSAEVLRLAQHKKNLPALGWAGGW